MRRSSLVVIVRREDVVPLARKRILRWALVLTPIALVATAVPAFAVADGEDVRDGKYAFSVKITAYDIPLPEGGTRQGHCSGVLIASKWIATAGHCFRTLDGKRTEQLTPGVTYKATVGRTDLTSTAGQEIKIVRVRQAPGPVEGQFGADLAVAELEHPVKGIKPIGLSTAKPKVGETLRLTGYGDVDGAEPFVPSNRLRTGQVTVAEVSDNAVGVRGKAPKATTSACLYDSGAPYFRERRFRTPVLVGVESDGPNCPHDQVETMARVDNIVPWIRSVIDGKAAA